MSEVNYFRIIMGILICYIGLGILGFLSVGLLTLTDYFFIVGVILTLLCVLMFLGLCGLIEDNWWIK